METQQAGSNKQEMSDNATNPTNPDIWMQTIRRTKRTTAAPGGRVPAIGSRSLYRKQQKEGRRADRHRRARSSDVMQTH